MPTGGLDSVVELFRETHQLAVGLRNSKAALARTALSRTLRAMSPDAMGESALALMRATGMNRARVSALSMWDKFYTSKGLAPQYPITILPVLGFIVDYAAVRANGSHVIKGAISNLRRAAQFTHQWEVDATGEDSITEATKAVKRALPSKPKEGVPVDIDALLVCMTHLSLEGDPVSLQQGPSWQQQ